MGWAGGRAWGISGGGWLLFNGGWLCGRMCWGGKIFHTEIFFIDERVAGWKGFCAALEPMLLWEGRVRSRHTEHGFED